MHPSLVLTVYAEELVTGARTAVFGDATLGLAEELLDRGARLVHVYDLDPARIAEATMMGPKRSIFYAPLEETGDIGVRDGAFDFVLVPDLSFTRRPEALLALARRILAPAGSLIVASPNPDASEPLVDVALGESPLGYYELYEAVAAHFRSVKMIGQAPFVGYAVVEFATEDEPEPTIDTSLAGDEKEPDWFVVLAGDRAARLDPFALIELPRRALALAGTERNVRASDVGVRSASEDDAVERIAAIERQRDDALEARDRTERLVEAERLRAEQASQRLVAREEELSLLGERTESLRQSLEQEESRRSGLEAEIEALRPEVAALKARGEMLEQSLAAAADEQGGEIAGLEAHLRERGREIEELRAELARRERLVREMLAELPAVAVAMPESSEGEGVASGLRTQLDQLALDASRREADLIAAGWKIAQLQRQLEQLLR